MPGPGSGISAQFGIATEATINTPVAVTRFIEVDNPSFDRRPNYAQGVGLHAGGLFMRAARRIEVSHDAGGSVSADLQTNGLGLFFQHMFGSFSTVATQIAAGPAWQQIHNFASTSGKTFTAQVGVPRVDQIVEPHVGVSVLFSKPGLPGP